MVGGRTWGVLQKQSPELHQTMGEMHNSGWFLCRERLITVPSFVALLLWEVGQGHYLLNAPRTASLQAAFLPATFRLRTFFHTEPVRRGDADARRHSAMQCIRRRIRRESGESWLRTACLAATHRTGFNVKELFLTPYRTHFPSVADSTRSISDR